MIKLIEPFNHKGQILEPGKVIGLSEELEKRMVAAKTAEKFEPENETVAEDLAKALDKKYNRDPLAEEAKKAGVEFKEDAKKADIIAAIIEQGKAEELLKEGE